MATIEVDLERQEVQRAGLAVAQCVYDDATALEDPATGFLVIVRDQRVLAEFPKGRYIMWRVLAPDPSLALAEDAPPDQELSPIEGGII